MIVTSPEKLERDKEYAVEELKILSEQLKLREVNLEKL